MTSSDALSECKRRRLIEIDRYYQTVYLTIGLKDYLDKANIGCRFVSAEPRFKDLDGKEVNPDIVFQYNNDNSGILCEVKTSISLIDYRLRERLKQLERYSKEVEGWDTSDKKVSTHDILLLCHAEDSDRVIARISEWMKSGELRISKKLCVAEWNIFHSLKYAQKDTMLIKYKYGEIGCDLLIDRFKQNIKFDIDKLSIKHEKCKFTRKIPPVEYTMNQLWDCIFPNIPEDVSDFTVDVDTILEMAYNYFIPWSGLQNEYSQVRKTWIKDAMKGFCDIGLAEELQSSSGHKESGNYKVFYGKNIKKNVGEYFVDRLCRKRIDDAHKLPIEETLSEAQRRLREFS